MPAARIYQPDTPTVTIAVDDLREILSASALCPFRLLSDSEQDRLIDASFRAQSALDQSERRAS